jgi:hypothetical protein
MLGRTFFFNLFSLPHFTFYSLAGISWNKLLAGEYLFQDLIVGKFKLRVCRLDSNLLIDGRGIGWSWVQGKDHILMFFENVYSAEGHRSPSAQQWATEVIPICSLLGCPSVVIIIRYSLFSSWEHSWYSPLNRRCDDYRPKHSQKSLGVVLSSFIWFSDFHV